MFGLGKKHADASWIAAPAEVLEAHQSAWAITTGNPAIVGNTELRWKLRLMVRPGGAAPFEATIDASLPQLTRPRPGTMLAVRFDPANHAHVELDSDEQAQAQAALQGVIGANPRLETAMVGGMSVADMMESALRDPNAFRGQMGQQAAAMQQAAMQQQAEAMAAAQAAQAEAAAQAAAAQAAAAQAAATQAGAGPASGPTEAQSDEAAGDRYTQLERLADLRDRGVLTEDEFQAEKRRVLGTV